MYNAHFSPSKQFVMDKLKSRSTFFYWIFYLTHKCHITEIKWVANRISHWLYHVCLHCCWMNQKHLFQSLLSQCVVYNQGKSGQHTVLRNFFAHIVLHSILHNTNTWTLTSCHWEEELHGYHVEGSCNLSEGPVERSVHGRYTFFRCSSSHWPAGRWHTLLILSLGNHARGRTAAGGRKKRVIS